ncbi:MAG TPA: hypothetical protein PK434_06950 [Microthrixaceae bacterium]|nr:hypothetical protein [Microthrixaceae bacterium]
MQEQLRVMVLVKAAPVLTAHLDETMCVAAMTIDDAPRWIRLHPVPFRDMEDESRFKKYQEVTAKVIRPKSDRRPESWTPIQGSMVPGEVLGTDHGWARRRERVESLGEVTMCDLVAANRTGSGPGTPSLGVVRPVEPPELDITTRDKEQLDKWRSRAEAVAARPSLFDDPSSAKPPFEVVPWRFRYRYRCASPSCNGHAQTIVDWEVNALWRKVRGRPDWENLMRQKFVDQLWADSRNTVLFVGNQEQRPQSFLILGIFWPPDVAFQPSLL